MIVAPDGDRLLLVTQEAHAHLTGDLAALLPPGPGNHAAFVAAARLHDNGWREADDEPRVDASGRPRTFSTVDDDTYAEVWRRGIARAADVDPLVGLLVGLHGARFFGHRDRPSMRLLAVQERERQDAVLAALGLGGSADALPVAVSASSQRIAFLDAVSLQLCGALGDVLAATLDGAKHEAVRDDAAVTVAPWPFTVQAWTGTVEARSAPDAPFADPEARRGGA